MDCISLPILTGWGGWPLPLLLLPFNDKLPLFVLPHHDYQ